MSKETKDREGKFKYRSERDPDNLRDGRIKDMTDRAKAQRSSIYNEKRGISESDNIPMDESENHAAREDVPMNEGENHAAREDVPAEDDIITPAQQAAINQSFINFLDDDNIPAAQTALNRGRSGGIGDISGDVTKFVLPDSQSKGKE